MSYRRSVALSLATLFAACTKPPPFPTPGRPAAEKAEFTDPFDYCAVIDTVDSPDERYTGPETPRAIVRGLRKALLIPEDAPMGSFAEKTVWRCMNGKVVACNAGVNIPCTEKADTSRLPRARMVEFCKANPGCDFIPAFATGKTTIYHWRCTDGEPVLVKQSRTPDARGFLTEIWHEIPRPRQR